VGRNCGGEKLLETILSLLLGFSNLSLFVVLGSVMSVMPLNLIHMFSIIMSVLEVMECHLYL
jgi:hypothetical protein